MLITFTRVFCLLLNSLGWWFCNCEAQRGWVPASYLEPLDGPDESEEPEPNYAGLLKDDFEYTWFRNGFPAHRFKIYSY